VTVASKAKRCSGILSLSLSLALLSCQTANPPAVVGYPIVFRTLEIGIYGRIRKSDTGQALTALRNLPSGSRVRLRIDSPGGDVFTALALAVELEKHDTTIEVMGSCHSACAQILLYSAKTIKFVQRGSVIFHTMPLRTGD
jgi:ATP-dependent protease ClpP protease subunit